MYDFQHAGGNFDVTLRSNGRFFCQKFQAAKATWAAGEKDGKEVLSIDWQKYGKYELAVVDGNKESLSGSAVGKPESWRKMQLKRPFTPAELNIFDSEWNFIHPGGSFKVEFRADGYNHFVCKDFPAHSHWKFVDDASTKLYINFGKFGEYELTLDAAGEKAEGSAKGDASNWRKMERIGVCDTEAVHEHDH